MEQSLEFNISISDMLYGVLKWKWVIILFVILFSLSGFYYTLATYEPEYRATASMVVNTKKTVYINDNIQVTQSSSDIHLAQDLIDTYSIILKSNKVLDYVVDDLSLDLSPEEIKDWVKLEQEKDTQILNIKVTCYDPELAVNIANSIMKVAPKAMMETVEVGSVNVLDKATIPKTSIPLNASKNILIASILGLFIGIVLSLSFVILIPKIKDKYDIEDKLVLQALGEIPHAKKSKEILINSDYANSNFVESFSILRTIFQFLTSVNNKKSIVITSAMQGEGKTTVSLNLAISLASSGKSTLLIDGDLKKPSIHKKLGISNSSKNIAQLIKDKKLIDDCITNISDNLDVILGDVIKVKSSNTLASYNLSGLLAALKVRYDYIIIDSPPVSSISDPLILSSAADGVLLVVKQDYASIKSISDIVYDINKLNTDIIGCVLNDIKHTSIGNGYNYNKYTKNYYEPNDTTSEVLKDYY